jgi:hypothetical protein
LLRVLDVTASSLVQVTLGNDRGLVWAESSRRIGTPRRAAAAKL